MKNYIFFIFCLFSAQVLQAQDVLTQRVVPGRTNSPEQQQKPYVVLISADGFRYDYADKYQAKNLLRLSKGGIQASSMLPAFPSKTFPNHYTLVTGLYPAHHGLINNRFYDPQRKEYYSPANRQAVEDGSWYGGIPLWVLAEQQQMLSASFYWVGSEADVAGVRPTYYYRYNEKIPIEERIQQVVNWLTLPEEKRPHLITFYLPEVDHAGHRYGPDAPETAEAVHFVDSAVQQLQEAVAATGLPVNFVFVSDHGMARVNTAQTIPLPTAIDTAKFLVSDGDIIIELHAKNRRDIRKTYKKLKKQAQAYKVYRKNKMPPHLHYGAKDDYYKRIGDIILVAEWPWIFNFSGSKRLAPGRHGYDPYQLKDMHASFYAWGPAFREGLTIDTFENVQVYPLITQLLGLSYSHPIDGNSNLANKILKPIP